MPDWTNRASYLLPRNGTTSHTIDPTSFAGLIGGSAFTPTPGRLLVVAMGVPSTIVAIPAGWSIPGSGSGSNDLRLALIKRDAVAGSNAFTVTHAASNVPMVAEIFEYPAGSQVQGAVWGKDIDNTGGANPQLNAPLVGGPPHSSLYAVKAKDFPGGYGYSNTAWSQSVGPVPTELSDINSGNGDAGSTGITWSLAYALDTAATAWAPLGASDGTRSGSEALTWAINATSSDVFPVTPSSVSVELNGQTGYLTFMLNGVEVIASAASISSEQITENADGTFSASGSNVSDNGDGTFTISSTNVVDNGDGTFYMVS